MRSRTVIWVLILFALSFSYACAPVVSNQFRREVKISVPFSEIQKNPERFFGHRVILGGYILKTTNEANETMVTVIQAPLNYLDEPQSRDRSQGRFIIRAKKFLDPEIYSKDRKITVAGTISGVRAEKLGNTTYNYPVIEPEELHLWPKQVYYRYPPPYWDWYEPWYCDRYFWRPYPRYPW